MTVIGVDRSEYLLEPGSIMLFLFGTGLGFIPSKLGKETKILRKWG
jgi:hypothetical protein